MELILKGRARGRIMGRGRAGHGVFQMEGPTSAKVPKRKGVEVGK